MSGLAWGDAFTFQAADLVAAAASNTPSRIASSFADGAANALVLDAVKRAAGEGNCVMISDERRLAEAELAAEGAPR